LFFLNTGWLVKMKKIKLSLVIATYNEEENIGDCIKSAKDIADEIIIIDGSSCDKTAEIAKDLGAKVFVVSNKQMFHKNKQLGLEKAGGEWILQLDADERVSKKLREEIYEITKVQGSGFKVQGYYIPRRNLFLGRFLKKGGQYPDYVIRLVRNGKARFPCKSVHEQIKVEGEVGYLKNDLIHLAVPNFSKYLQNANRYTTLTADKYKMEKLSLNLFNKLKYLFLLPLATFLKLFVRHRGFIDGFPGFVFALFSGLHHSIAFIKYWEKNEN